jgi:DeoR/GlpR family transcriptional regulator of sugar metabolism
MLARQRDELILSRLRQTGSETARELAALLKVSPATIRRDLERLERTGALERVYGGAFLPGAAPPRRDGVEGDGADAAGLDGAGIDGVDGPGDEPRPDLAVARNGLRVVESLDQNVTVLEPGESPFAEVIDKDGAHKDRVAGAAASLVHDGQVVLLDIGTTTLRIARALRGRPVTVVTSSLAVLDVLRDDLAVELVILGGTVRRNFQSLVGPLTLDALGNLRTDQLFLSCTGVHPDGSVVDDISVEASVKRAMIETARQVVLVAPAAKFPGTGSLRICHVRDVDTVVTSVGADATTLEECRQAGGRVITA